MVCMMRPKILQKSSMQFTPIFGYNKNLELQYRGRIRELKDLKPLRDGDSELLNAMIEISKSGKGPDNQFLVWVVILSGNDLITIITRSFPPSVGGIQNLGGLAKSISGLDMLKVFADYEFNHEEFDNEVSFSIERIGGVKFFRKYRKAYLIKII